MTLPLARLFLSSGRFLLPAAVLLSSLALRADEGEGAADKEEQVIQAIVRLVDGEKGGEDSGYWIGVACEPLENELREKLKIEKGNGLRVSQVVPESPAAKAGLKNDDIIVAIGNKSLKSVEQLAEAVAEAKEHALKLHIVRQGERQVVVVKPAKREGEKRIIVLGEGDEKSKQEALQKLRKQLEELSRAEVKQAEAAKKAEGSKKGDSPKGESKQPERIIIRTEQFKGAKGEAPQVQEFKWEGGGGRIILSPGPVPPGAPVRAWGSFIASPQSLPDDMKVTIHKQGKQPATIVVEQGAKLWKTTENEMGMLPAEARAYAARLLGQPGAVGGFGGGTGGFGLGGGAGSGVSGGAPLKVPVPAPGAPAKPGEGKPLHFELRLGPQGQVIGGEHKLPPGASVKKLEGGVIEIELRETDEKRSAEKNPAAQPRWIELKRPEPSPEAKKKAEAETRELTDKLQQLRKQLEELRKAAEEKKK